MKGNTATYSKLAKELNALCKKHGVAFTGNLKAVSGFKSFSINIEQELSFYGGKDRTGPFLVFDVEMPEAKPVIFPKNKAFEVLDREAVMRGGIKSMADGQMYDSRNAYSESLKRNGMVEIGDAGVPSGREIKGDFSCRNELKDAIQKHMGV